MVVVGMLLFGFGVGNANLLPPLIAQIEFSHEDVLRSVSLITAISQAVYAFAPALFGLIRDFAHPGTLSVGSGRDWRGGGGDSVSGLIRNLPRAWSASNHVPEPWF